jgi:hypothetical protein
MRRGAFYFLVLLSAATVASGGCGGGGSDNSFGDGGDDGGASGDGALGGDSPHFGGDGSGGCQPLKCAADLHSVLDCNGNVVSTCPADKGCANGACVAPCDAAKLNKSTIGCDYYSVNPDTSFAAGACFAAFVANTWSSPISLAVDFNGQSLDPSTFARVPQGSGQSITYKPLAGGQLAPGEIAILFLAQTGPAKLYAPACPAGVTPAVSATDAAPHGTSLGHAFHITSTAPVVAYDIFPYGGGVSAIASATLLIPTTAWDTNYVAVDAYATPAGGSANNYPFLDVVAMADGTHVKISPTAAIVAGNGVAAAPAGQTTTYTLARGQVLHVLQNAELNGSPIQSDSPVGVFGGNACMDVPNGVGACDAAHQQIPPVKALGHEYVAVRYRNRFNGQEESPPWRLVGAVDGTTLTYDPAPPTGAPTTLASGQLAQFNAAGPFVVKSQDAAHPFYLAGYMTGSQQVDPSGADARGDPEFVNVIPPQEFLSDYVFFTDPTYPETNLVFVRAKAADGSFKDVTLDCLATPLTGWQPVGAGGQYQYTRFDLVTGNFQKIGNCDNGRREAKSDGPFGVTVWGWGSAATGGQPDPTMGGTGFYSQFVSYAYPAGASVQPINSVVVPPR